WSREKAAAYRERMSAAQTKLRTAQQQLTSLQANPQASTPDAVSAAQKRVTDAVSEIDRVNKAAGADGAPAPSRGPAAQGAKQPPGKLYGHKDGKEVFLTADGKYVYGDGAEVK